ncbi:cupin domain-containing protein [uncultured Roseobacter sp.]|uniref:cupin domain-containing protein n=1 Tax=uncultured Roseobacter sp. TaxID=114847 RepID=UPI0026250C5D|nr:cupin domain-containing protein [uncultured Roseobacter sp.]
MELPTVTNRTTAPHYIWGSDDCDGWRLLDTAGLSVIEEWMPPQSHELRHFHRAATQLFYVLEGHLAIEVAQETHHLGPGDAMPVLPPTPDQVRNDSADDARFLVISAPATTNDRQTT